MPMTPASSLQYFLARLEVDEVTLKELTPTDGIEAMLAFYTEQRAKGCSLDNDGDMLLYEWGTYNWGEGEAFEFNITRQFIDSKRAFRQLRLRFKFAVSKKTQTCKAGNRWCELPDNVDEFRRYIRESKAYKLVQTLTPADVILELTRP
jgi:hypothetical protein